MYTCCLSLYIAYHGCDLSYIITDILLHVMPPYLVLTRLGKCYNPEHGARLGQLVPPIWLKHFHCQPAMKTCGSLFCLPNSLPLYLVYPSLISTYILSAALPFKRVMTQVKSSESRPGFAHHRPRSPRH